MKHSPSLSFLRYFYSAAQSKSISKAAKENFVSQSAISQGISKLETAFGRQLITHEKNHFRLTSNGELLFEKCRLIFSVLLEIEDDFNEADGEYKGKLCFACTHSFALSLLPQYLSKLSKIWPKVEPVLRFGHTGTIIELVKKGDVDFGIVLDNEDFSNFHTRKIYEGKHGLYKAKKPLDPPLNRLILSEERKEILLLKKHLEKNKIEISNYMEVSSWEVIASLTEQGLGIGFLPDYIAHKRSLTIAPIKIPSISYKILAIYLKNRTLSRNAAQFIELMCAN